MQPIVFVIAKPYDAEVVRKAAVEAGYVAALSDGSDRPLERIQRDSPAVVVLSLRLSRTNATQLLMQLRTDPVIRHVPVILISEADSSLTLKDALQLGADHLVLRPLDPVLLMAKIESLIVDAASAPASRAVKAPEGPVSGAEGPAEAEVEAEAAPAPAAEAEDPARVERFRVRLERRHALVREGDYFALLDLEPDASAEAIQLAHSHLLRELDRAALPPAVVEELAAALDETLEVLDEAYRILGDERLREAYRKTFS